MKKLVAVLSRFPLRAGARDLILALLLGVASIVAPRLEPSYSEFWLFLTLGVAAPLVCSGVLLLLPWRLTTILGICIHMVLLYFSGGVVVLSVFMLVTFYFAGTAIVLGPPALLLAVSSAAALAQSIGALTTNERTFPLSGEGPSLRSEST